jgi:hypothetical protein
MAGLETVVGTRWEVGNGIFLEVKDNDVLVEVGPLPGPLDAESEKLALERLIWHRFPWLVFGEKEWCLDLQHLTHSYVGRIPHPAGFESVGSRKGDVVHYFARLRFRLSTDLVKTKEIETPLEGLPVHLYSKMKPTADQGPFPRRVNPSPDLDAGPEQERKITEERQKTE